MESPASACGNVPQIPNRTLRLQEYRQLSPFHIPEILIRIGGYMDRPTVMASQLVCREWHQTLEFLAWDDLKLVQHGSQFEDPMTDNFIHQHASFVERLSIQIDPLMYDGNLDERLCLRTVVFPKLESLYLFIQREEASLDEMKIKMEYLTSNLLRLMLKSSSLGNSGGDGFRTLQVLKIKNFHFEHMPRDWMILWETLWSRLQVLSLVGAWWDTSQIFEEEKDLDILSDESRRKREGRSKEMCNFTKMEELARRLGPSLTMQDFTLISDSCRNEALYEIQRWMVLQCPKLVRLEWRVECTESPMMMIRDTIMNGRQQNPPQFQDLEAVTLGVFSFAVPFFLHLVSTMPRLTELNINGIAVFDFLAWELFKVATPHHLQTLRVIKARECGLETSSVVDMLCILPNLEVFEGDYITDLGLQEDPRPWACRGTLKRLCLDFKVARLRQLLSQPMFIRRLVELEQLQDLIVTESNLRLDLSKPDGALDGLRNLKRLKSFSFHTRRRKFYNCSWGLAEVAWVREHWPELKYVDSVQYKREVPERLRFPAIPKYVLD